MKALKWFLGFIYGWSEGVTLVNVELFLGKNLMAFVLALKFLGAELFVQLIAWLSGFLGRITRLHLHVGYLL